MPDEPAERLHTEFYDRYTTTHFGSTNTAAAAATYTADVVPHLPASRQARILDLGCGRGELMALLHSDGYVNAVGVDISAEQVRTAQRAGVRGVTHGDYRSELDRGGWDVVIAMDFLEHLPRVEVLPALQQVRRNLNPGGLLIARTPNALHPLAAIYQYGDFTHESVFTPASMRQLLALANFPSIEIRQSRPTAAGAAAKARSAAARALGLLLRASLAAETGIRSEVMTLNLVAIGRMTVAG